MKVVAHSYIHIEIAPTPQFPSALWGVLASFGLLFYIYGLEI